jgi:hypothetical protein
LIQGGKKELSNGYSADYDFQVGVTPRGDSYQAIQRNMRGNHIAIVDRGRCGAVCAVSDDDKGTSMAKVKITLDDGSEVEVDEAVASVIVKSNAQRDKAQDDLKSLRKLAKDEEEEKAKEDEEEEKEDEEEEEETDEEGKPISYKSTDAALLKRLAKAEASLDALRESQPTDDELDARVEARAKVVSDAKRLMGKTFSTDGKTNGSIRREVVSARVETDVADKSDDYIEARFDSLAGGGGESSRFSQRNLGSSARASDSVTKIDSARRKSVADAENAWKRPEDQQVG